MAKPISNATLDNEKNKFQEDSGGDVAVNIVGKQLQGIIDAINQESGFSDEVLNEYDEVFSVANGVKTEIVNYTVPVDEELKLILVEFSGENIATYEIEVNSVVIAKKRTYFSGDLFGQFDFNFYDLVAGDVISLKVTHNRPNSGDFEGRILGIKQ